MSTQDPDPQSAFDHAVADAERMAQTLREADNQEEAAEVAFSNAVDTLEAKKVEGTMFLPATGKSERMNFFRGKAGRKKLLDTYLDLLREKLCGQDGELHKLAHAGLHSVAASVMTLVITTLALPMVALPFAITLTAILLSTGVEAFCKWAEPANESA